MYIMDGHRDPLDEIRRPNHSATTLHMYIMDGPFIVHLKGLVYECGRIGSWKGQGQISLLCVLLILCTGIELALSSS
jgi:hypothetical protein